MVLHRVTQNHINRGRQMFPKHCPVALCLREDYPKLNLYVTHQGVVITSPTGTFRKFVKHSVRVRRFIEKFDIEGCTAVKPFNFKLDLAGALCEH